MPGSRGTARCLLLGCGVALAGCAAPAPAPKPGVDVACLKQQVIDLHEAYWQALETCHSPKVPDLTGNLTLQRAAAAYRLPFSIRPKADALLKQQTGQTLSGTRIVGADPAF